MTREPGEGVKSLNASTVREYRADGTLHAYRDGDEHVVVSKGNDRGDQWEKRVPAERSEVNVGDHLWTVPENWEFVFTVRPDDTSKYGVYTIPSTGETVKVSVPVKDRICDAWYGVRAVGELIVEYDDSCAWDELDKLSAMLGDDSGDDYIADVIDALAENQDSVAEAIKEEVDCYAREAVTSGIGETTSLSSWRLCPWLEQFDYTDVIGEVIQADEEALEEAVGILEAKNVLPVRPMVRVRIGQ